jgi:hypothetical protein
VVIVTAAKPLPAAPSITVTPIGLAQGSFTFGTATGSGTSWTLPLQLVTSPVAGTFELAATATDDVGHVGRAGTSFVMNNANPTITSLALNASRYSAVTGFNGVTLYFDYADDVDGAEATTISAVIGGYLANHAPMTMYCAPRATSPNYVCTYGAVGTELSTDNVTPISTLSQAVLPITIEATDSVGNQVFSSTTATFDFLAPALASTPSVQYFPAPNLFTTGSPAACSGKQNVLTTVTAATTCTDIRATFAMTETLSANPTVTAASGAITFSPSTVSGLAYVYDGATTVAGTPPDNAAYGIQIVATDLVGNSSTLTTASSPPSATLALDTTAPAAPNTAAAGPITYMRIPWGDQATNGVATYSVTGAANAGVPNGTLLVYDGPSPSTADVLGHGAIGADGSFGGTGGIPLTRADHSVVYLANADSAGNLSPSVAVHNVSWTASYGGKANGATGVNPNVLLADQALDLIPAGRSTTQVGETLLGVLQPAMDAAPEASSYTSLFAGSTTPLTGTFNPIWSEVTPAVTPTARLYNCMAYDAARGVTVLFGGGNDSGQLNDTWEWDGAAWSQLTVNAGATGPGLRVGSMMAYDAARGVSVMFGGFTPVGGGGFLFHNDTWEWDGSAWTQLTADGSTASPAGRLFGAMSYDAARGVLVLFGGAGTGLATLNDTWEWNGTAWSEVTANGAAGSPVARNGHALAYDAARGVTLLFGGALSSGTTMNDTWEWNGTGWSQLTLNGAAGSPLARDGSAMAYEAARGVTLLVGGQASTSGPNYNDTWEWNGASWSQLTATGAPGSPAVRYGQGMAFDSARGVAVLFGGYTGSSYFDDTWEWNGTAWTQRTVNGAFAAPAGRELHSMVYDSARGVAVVFGGNVSGTVFNDTWEWSPSGWSQRTANGAATSPPAKEELAMAYDAARGETVLFGGTGYQNDTWEWNGAAWTQRTVNGAAGSPAGRVGDAMSYDAARGATVLFGGYTGSAYLNDTWKWNGSAWTSLIANGSAGSPPGRYDHALAYDAARGVTVLFGGRTGSGYLNDTWEWNGTAWTQRTLTGASGSPPARYGHAMAYDAARGTTILFSGNDGTGQRNDTWEWNGTTWTQLEVNGATTGPVARDSVPMIYDTALQASLLFGGFAGNARGQEADVWVLPSGLLSRPADIARFDFAATGESSTSANLQSMTFSATAGGTGSSTAWDSASGTATSGATMAVWSAGGWHTVKTNNATVAMPTSISYSTGDSAEAGSYLLAGPWQMIDVSWFPTSPTGNGIAPGEIALLDPELSVQYVRSESACGIAVDGGCLCASDETACGTYCSNTNADPQNCGGCTAQGTGTVCQSGQQCIQGACACPGTEVTCEGVCTDTTTDPLNCGGCGSADAGSSCGPFKACVAGACSACQAGQFFNGTSCVSDLKERVHYTRFGMTGTASVTSISTTAGDRLFFMVAPSVPGFFTSSISTTGTESWSLVGEGNEAGQYLAIYTAVATGSTATVAVSVETLAGDGGFVTANVVVRAELVAFESQAGATISVDSVAFGGSLTQSAATAAGITTAGTAPGITATAPSEVVLLAAAQPQTASALVFPTAETVSSLSLGAGYVWGYYSLAAPGQAPAMQFTGGSAAATWEIAQISISSNAQ